MNNYHVLNFNLSNLWLKVSHGGGFPALGFNGEIMAGRALGKKKKKKGKSEVKLNRDFKKWKIKV